MARTSKVWEDCKTKQEKEAFKRDMERMQRTGTCIPFDKLVFNELMRRL